MDIVWTLFVLDFDWTYSIEGYYDIGVPPVVYLIPQSKIKEVQKCASRASEDFGCSEDGDWGIGDYFEEYMKEMNIPFKEIGDINIPFGERQHNYLADYIPREVV